MPYSSKDKNSSYQKQYREANREKAKEYSKEYTKKNREKIKEKRKTIWLKYKYGISEQDYNKMFEEQNGCCYICSKHQSSFKRALVVDHCHTTGKVRKLLCGNCNWALGHAYEDPKILKRMISYLEEFK